MAMRRFLVPSLVLVVGASFAEEVPAPVTPPVPGETTTGERLVVTADQDGTDHYAAPTVGSLGFELSDQQVPATVNVVSDDFWRATGARTLDGVLPYVPGVNLTDNGGWTGDTIAIRGFPAALPYRDGRRTIGSYGQGNRLMPDTIDRIEVVKGPAGADFGVVEPGGTINIITKKPQRVAGASAHATVGEHGYRRVGAEATGALTADGSVQGLLVAAYEEPPEWRDGRPDDTDRAIFAPSINWNYRDDGNLLLSYQRQTQDGPQDRGIIYLEGAWAGGFAPREWSFHQTSSQQSEETDRITLANTQDLGEGTQLRTAVEYQRLHYQLREFRNAMSEPGWGPLYEADGVTWTGVRVIPLLWSDWEGTGEALSGVIDLEQKLKIGETTHTVTVGGRGYRNGMENQYVSYTVDNTFDILDPVNNQVADIVSMDGIYTDEIDIEEYGASAKWLGEWTPAWRTIVAAQLLRYAYSYQGFSDGVADFSDSYDYNTLSLRLATSYDLTPDLTVFVGASDGYQPQSGIMRNGDPVEPIRDRAVEGGVKARLLGGDLLWTTSVYHTRRDHLTVSDPANSPGESFLVNAGSAEITGVETEAVGRIGPDLILRGGVALTDSEVIENEAAEFEGNEFANTPQVQGGVFASYSWSLAGLPGLSTGLGVRYMGERYGNIGNTITLPDYVLIDASLGYVFAQRTSLVLSATNLLDETYYTGMQDGNGNGADQVMVGEIRVIALTCRHEF